MKKSKWIGISENNLAFVDKMEVGVFRNNISSAFTGSLDKMDKYVEDYNSKVSMFAKEYPDLWFEKIKLKDYDKIKSLVKEIDQEKFEKIEDFLKKNTDQWVKTLVEQNWSLSFARDYSMP